MENLPSFSDWLALREGSRWRADDTLPKVAGHTDGRIDRLSLLAKAGKAMGKDRESQLPGWKKFVSGLDFRDEDAPAIKALSHGRQPATGYRGASRFDSLTTGGLYQSVYGSAIPSTAAEYGRNDQVDGVDVGGKFSDGPNLYSPLARFAFNPDATHTQDYGFERAEDEHTPHDWHSHRQFKDDVDKYGMAYAVKKWHYETKMSKDRHQGYSLAKRGTFNSKVAPLDDRGVKVVKSAGRLLGKGEEWQDVRANYSHGDD